MLELGFLVYAWSPGGVACGELHSASADVLVFGGRWCLSAV